MKNDSVGFIGVIALAIGLIAFKGAGTTSVFDTVVASTIEGTAASTVASELSQAQMFDINSLMGSLGSSGKLIRTETLATVQESSLLAYQTVDASAIDHEEESNGIRKYEVQGGDVLSEIAFDYDLSIQTLIAANNISNINALKPGTILTIPPIDGVVHVVKSGDTVGSIAQKYKAASDKIVSYNDLPLSGDLRIGQELIIPGGVLAPKAVATVRPVAGSKRFAGLPKFDGYYITPATCIITQRAHIRNGYDCAAKVGTPIYAMASGQVNFVQATGNYHGYGRMVRITHANGTETLYGHLSQALVSVGETVSQGQVIGYMGNTGKSTGPHLHVEVHGAYNILARYPIRGQVIAKQQ
ncbi:MAG: M23 family metallopeptidase [Patescibacteria group bacterium]